MGKDNIRENIGYKIIRSEVYTIDERNVEYEIVLGQKITASGTSYVTWECSRGDNFYWGHYINDKMDALIDYHKRLLWNYENIVNKPF